MPVISVPARPDQLTPPADPHWAAKIAGRKPRDRSCWGVPAELSAASGLMDRPRISMRSRRIEPSIGFKLCGAAPSLASGYRL